ncbi:hypothetical protein LguiA_032376 [Lonicera macranthoides]
MLGQARYLCVIGRARLVPTWLAKVHPSTGTPLNATLFLAIRHLCESQYFHNAMRVTFSLRSVLVNSSIFDNFIYIYQIG